jgi:hypothetical protein
MSSPSVEEGSGAGSSTVADSPTTGNRSSMAGRSVKQKPRARVVTPTYYAASAIRQREAGGKERGAQRLRRGPPP